MVEGHIAEKVSGSKLVGVHLLTFGRARIGIGPVDASWYDDVW